MSSCYPVVGAASRAATHFFDSSSQTFPLPILACLRGAETTLLNASLRVYEVCGVQAFAFAPVLRVAGIEVFEGLSNEHVGVKTTIGAELSGAGFIDVVPLAKAKLKQVRKMALLDTSVNLTPPNRLRKYPTGAASLLT